MTEPSLAFIEQAMLIHTKYTSRQRIRHFVAFFLGVLLIFHSAIVQSEEQSINAASVRVQFTVAAFTDLDAASSVSMFSRLYFLRLTRAEERYQRLEAEGQMHPSSWESAVQSLKDCTTNHATDPRRFEILWASFNKALSDVNDAGQGDRPAYEVLDEVLDVLCRGYMASYWIKPPQVSYVNEVLAAQPAPSTPGRIEVLDDIKKCQFVAAPSFMGARIISGGKTYSADDLYEVFKAAAVASLSRMELEYQREYSCSRVREQSRVLFPVVLDDYGRTFELFMYTEGNGVKATANRDGFTIPESNQVYQPSMFPLGVRQTPPQNLSNIRGGIKVVRSQQVESVWPLNQIGLPLWVFHDYANAVVARDQRIKSCIDREVLNALETGIQANFENCGIRP